MTQEDGNAVYDLIHDPLRQGETVELDFEGVDVFASPFFNASVGRLLEDLERDALNDRLRFEHLSAFGERGLRRAIENAEEYYAASPDHRQAVDRIVQETAEAM
ncbi:MAG: STAS-like domain-containing protein [Candidatus Contendobacter sp.]|nr:STAS-like domain-containing protein [Candidatus Contendobacter sp.]